MSDIPKDVLETAKSVWLEADDKILRTDAYVVIALAILAERERSRTLFSEADQREKDARRAAVEDALDKAADLAVDPCSCRSCGAVVPSSHAGECCQSPNIDAATPQQIGAAIRAIALQSEER